MAISGGGAKQNITRHRTIIGLRGARGRRESARQEVVEARVFLAKKNEGTNRSRGRAEEERACHVNPDQSHDYVHRREREKKGQT